MLQGVIWSSKCKKAGPRPAFSRWRWLTTPHWGVQVYRRSGFGSESPPAPLLVVPCRAGVVLGQLGQRPLGPLATSTALSSGRLLFVGQFPGDAELFDQARVPYETGCHDSPSFSGSIMSLPCQQVVARRGTGTCLDIHGLLPA